MNFCLKIIIPPAHAINILILIFERWTYMSFWRRWHQSLGNSLWLYPCPWWRLPRLDSMPGSELAIFLGNSKHHRAIITIFHSYLINDPSRGEKKKKKQHSKTNNLSNYFQKRRIKRKIAKSSEYSFFSSFYFRKCTFCYAFIKL